LLLHWLACTHETHTQAFISLVGVLELEWHPRGSS
jgi:hypothetical protein